jgi:ankyrin repeat protein
VATQQTRDTVRRYFQELESGNLENALGLLAENVVFELPKDVWNEVIPYLGRHEGVTAVADAFAVRGETTKILEYELRSLSADGGTAYAVIYTKAAHTRTGQVFEIEDAHRLEVDEAGRITAWKVYFDPNSEVAAFTADREQRLWAAVRNRDATAVAELAGQGADVNRRDEASGLTPLMLAAGQADDATVRVLLRAGADVHAADARAGASALHKACQGGSLEVVESLLAAGAQVDSVAPTTGHTPLMDALWYKFPRIARCLLDHGAALKRFTSYGFSLEEHFEYELNVNVAGKDLLLEAEKYLDDRRQADQRQLERHPLLGAVAEGHTDVARQLLADGAVVDARYPVLGGFNDAHTPLLVAARDGHTEIVGLLLEAGADVNAVEPTFGAVPLHKAVYNGHAGITRLIAAAPGTDLNFQGATNGYTPLHDAIWHGYVECAEVLLDAGAATDRTGHDGLLPAAMATAVLGADHPLTRRLVAAG